nr:HNH endonuclease family protein [Bacteroides xylanisolvens]
MPTKKEFQNTFKLIGYSNHCEYYHDNKNKQRAEMALNILEQIKSGRVDVTSFTIEHILPDSQDRENAMIGNLIPLEENLNSLCKDKELHEKIPIYNRSYFSTARNVSNRYKGNEANFKINSRSTIMADNLYDEISHILNAL